jgi:hypothetical protein
LQREQDTPLAANPQLGCRPGIFAVKRALKSYSFQYKMTRNRRNPNTFDTRTLKSRCHNDNNNVLFDGSSPYQPLPNSL